jgi:hypothetical protein
MTRVIVVVYEAEIYQDGRMFSVPRDVAKSLNLQDEIDVVIRTRNGRRLVLAERLKMTSGAELYVTSDRLQKFGLKPKDSIIIEASKP